MKTSNQKNRYPVTLLSKELPTYFQQRNAHFTLNWAHKFRCSFMKGSLVSSVKTML